MIIAWQILAGALLCVLCLALADRFASRRRMVRLRRLAIEYRYRYSQPDRFNLANRIASVLPEPGSADVRVHDVMYRSNDAGYRYVFTAEYIVGTIGGRRRRKVVASTSEPHGRSRAAFETIELADGTGDFRDQYRSQLIP